MLKEIAEAFMCIILAAKFVFSIKHAKNKICRWRKNIYNGFALNYDINTLFSLTENIPHVDIPIAVRLVSTGFQVPFQVNYLVWNKILPRILS